MPATKDHVLAIARSQLGYTERAGNRTVFGRWFGMDGVAWCAIFVSWVADKANAEDIIPRHAYTPSGAAWFVKAGRWSQKAKRGDIVYYEFPGMHRISHVGIVEAVHRDGSITAIEGNTDVAGGRTGGRVMRKRRSRSLIAGFGHPDYSTPAQMAALARKAEAAAKASRLAKARALAAAKVKAARDAAAKALATRRAKASAAAAAAAAAAALALGTGVVPVGGPDAPTPQPTPSVSVTPTPSGTVRIAPVVTPTPTPTPTATRSPAVTPTATPRPTATKAPAKTVKPKPAVTLRRVLSYAPARRLQTGADVRKVQALVGLRGKAVDGEYGKRSAAAVRTWQRAHKLKADGVFGRKSTLKAGWRWAP